MATRVEKLMKHFYYSKRNVVTVLCSVGTVAELECGSAENLWEGEEEGNKMVCQNPPQRIMTPG